MSISVAILLDDRSLLEWEAQSIRHLSENSIVDANISLVVVNDRETSTPFSEQVLKFFGDFSLWSWFVAYRIIEKMLVGPHWYQRRVPLEEAVDLTTAEVHSYTPEPASGYGNVLPGDAVETLSDTDIAIRFGFGILKGDALTAPRYGVLSYHHGDIAEYRGRPSGFYELIHGKSEAGVTVQRLTDELDAGTVVSITHCAIGDATSLPEVHDRQFSASPPLLTEGIDNIINETLPDQPETLGPIYSTPGFRDVLKYVYLRTKGIISRHVP